MQTLDLECPSCGERLELDAGFAGGVCRCSKCGTLMTVPRETGRAEQLSTPATPGELSDASIASAPIEHVPRQRSRSASKRGRGKRGRRAGSATIDAGEYRTASGKIVRVEAPIRVPMAQSKRKQIRIATTAVFIAVVLGVMLVAAIAVWAMISGGKPDVSGDADDNTADTAPPVYDASLNPYELGFANIAGLPLEGKVAIVTEATKGDSEYWMPQASELIKSGLSSSRSTAQAALFAAAKDETVAFGSGKPTAVSKISQAKLDAWFTGLAFTDEADRADAIEEALTTNPDMLILVFSGGSDEQVEAWKEIIGNKKVTVHAVLIDSLAPQAVKQWLIKRKDSETLILNSRDLESWQEIAEQE